MPLPTEVERRKYMFTDDVKFLQKAIVFHPLTEKILALKRPENAFTRPSCWDLPGGNVLFGQLHLDSLLEEISEETSLKVKNVTPVVVETRYDDVKKTYSIFIGYECTATSDNVKLSSEHTEFKWVALKEFLKLESGDFLKKLVNTMIEK